MIPFLVAPRVSALAGCDTKNAGGWKKHKDRPWKGGPSPSECKHLTLKEQPTRTRKEVKDRRIKPGNPMTSYSHRTPHLRNALRQMKKIRTNPLKNHQELSLRRRNLEAYMDNMVIKSKTELEMIKDVEETLLTLKKESEEIQKKTKTVVNIPSPSNLKQMKWLSGKLSALNRFLSKATERALPCLDTLKKCTNKKDFHWTIEAEEAFQAVKKLI
ncbi:hypothetical protein Tco_1528215, partial [Tanacetum coccineum]